MDQINLDAFSLSDEELCIAIGVLSAFAAVLALRFMAWLLPARSWFTVSGRRGMMPRDPPEIVGQKMADSIVDFVEDKVYRKELTPDQGMFMYALLANVLGDKDYLPKGEKLLRERLNKILNPPMSTTDVVNNILSTYQKKG